MIQGTDDAQKQVEEISADAKRLGVELDARKAKEWILAASVAEGQSAFAQDTRAGVFGHRISLLDFDQKELDHFRHIANKVRVVAHPYVESAIAIAGSSAQGKVQLFPGDMDFFERVNIKAATEIEAREILRRVTRETALRAFAETDVVLLEVNFGVYRQAVVERGRPRAAGHVITWTPNDVAQGFIVVQTAAGQPLRIDWEGAESGLGYTFFGFIVADPDAGRIVLASNMLDPTWEAADGKIMALDGTLDPFFQEIYLEPAALPIFSKVTQQVEPNAMNAYVDAMRSQVIHYAHEEPNYGKVSKRLYNLFRLTDQLESAAYVRELFDEPGAKLYQVPGLLEAANAALGPNSRIHRDTVVCQIDLVIRAVVEAAEGPREADLVMALIRLRDHVIGRALTNDEWSQMLEEVTQLCREMVNEYFRERLLGVPQIKSYVEGLKP